jgi:cutinase
MRNRFIAGVASALLVGSLASCTNGGSSTGGASAGGNGATNILAGCSPVRIFVARGTFELPETSPLGTGGFVSAFQLRVPGTSRYDVQYRADLDYVLAPMQGANNLTSHIKKRAAQCPNEKYVLTGYSKGAMVVVDAMSMIPAAIEQRVKAVVLYGNPFHDPRSKANAPGIGNNSPNAGGLVPGVNIPMKWRDKTRDYCNTGDPICGAGVNILAHLAYPADDMAAANWAADQVAH